MISVIDKTLDELRDSIAQILDVTDLPAIEPANPKFGADYALPAFTLARDLHKSPQEIAQQITQKLQHSSVGRAEATAGYVNIWLSDQVLAQAIAQAGQQGSEFGTSGHYRGKKTVIETNNPNPFKDMHIGHAYNSIVADTLANLLQAGGSDVHRVSYHGDVGLHVGKSMWAILHYLDGDAAKLEQIPAGERAQFLSKMYVQGANAYADNPDAKGQIEDYAWQSFLLDDPLYKQVYDICKQWSFDYLDQIIHAIGSQPGERRYLESQADRLGRQVVEAHTGDVFTRSDGAIIFPGEKYGLHTRVFISSRDTTLYEARDLGLLQLKHNDYHPDTSYIVTAEEQREYFSVVLKAAELALPELKGETTNIPTGTVKLSTGKMSSRTGQVVNIEWIFDALRQAIIARGAANQNSLPATMIGALRYAMLRVKVGGDLVFDINESVSLEGNSGPYLQYAHARGRSILAKLGEVPATPLTDLTPDERTLAAKVMTYPLATQAAIAELAPHHITTYLYELTQQFNRFYEKNRIIDDPRQNQRAQLVQAYCQVLANGLGLLSIPAPERL